MNLFIGAIALLFSILCFYLFFRNATEEAIPEKVVDAAAQRAELQKFGPETIGALAKALAEAFSKAKRARLSPASPDPTGSC